MVSPHLHALDKASAAARQHGLTTHMVSSRNRDSGDETYAALAARKVDILLITEKRLANAEFERLALPHLLTTGLLVLDEAETISRSYGGFTRGYAHAVHRLLDQAPGAAVLALSGSGTYDVVSDLNAILGPTSITVRHPILDTSLNLAVVKDLAPAARIAWATDAVEAAVGPAIVYARDQREAELLTGLLKSRGQAVYVHDPSSKAAPTADETPPGVIVTYAPGFA
ncbi:MAG: ATP-dependent helicase RecQ, partial [Actinomycetota bacterium]|nr:ATP-dependent helicase RecQ [Actinomycetota bacterium]